MRLPCLLPPHQRRQRLCDAELAAHEQYSLSSICGGMGLISVPSSCSILYLQCSVSGKCEQAASEHVVELSCSLRCLPAFTALGMTKMPVPNFALPAVTLPLPCQKVGMHSIPAPAHCHHPRCSQVEPVVICDQVDRQAQVPKPPRAADTVQVCF